MTLPRIKVLALGGTIATRPDASGAMQMGLGADDLVAAVPALAALAAIDAETVSRVGSHSLGFDQIHALAARIAALDADGVIVTQGTDTLEETAFLLDLLQPYTVDEVAGRHRVRPQEASAKRAELASTGLLAPCPESPVRYQPSRPTGSVPSRSRSRCS